MLMIIILRQTKTKQISILIMHYFLTTQNDTENKNRLERNIYKILCNYFIRLKMNSYRDHVHEPYHLLNMYKTSMENKIYV
jgi:hypothetical protein